MPAEARRLAATELRGSGFTKRGRNRLSLIVVVGTVTTVAGVALALLDWPSPFDHDPWQTVGVIVLVGGIFSALGSLGWRVLISEARRRLDSPTRNA